MAVTHVVLGLLARRPAHGYRLRSEVDALLGRAHAVTAGRLYGVLRALRAAGLVTPHDEASSRRVRRVYEITAAGRAALRAWHAAPAAGAPLQHDRLLLKVVVADRAAATMPARLLRAERDARERALREIASRVKGSLLERLHDERAARHLAVELWLLDRLAERGGCVSLRTPGSASR